MKKPLIDGPGGCTEAMIFGRIFRRLSFLTFPITCLLVFCLCLLNASEALGKYETHEADFIPWSGYWWPNNYGGLGTGYDYRGHPAPLEKYEWLTRGNSSSTLTDWYLNRFYNPDAPFWYGMCAYWARAAVYENYDILPSSEDNIVFRVGDKKGLLTLAHADDLTESGDGYDPGEFHYWLLHYIKDLGQPFIADLEGVDEVWSYPIYRYEMASTQQGGVEKVSVTVYYADDFVHPDYMGTKELSKTLTYDLYLSGNAIAGGEWTGLSAGDPPRRLSIPLSVHSEAPDFDYSKVVEISKSSDDFLENPGSEWTDIYPGTYHLVLLNPDQYRIGGVLPGDEIRLQVDKQEGSSQEMVVELKDGSGGFVGSARLKDGDEPYTVRFTAGSPPYHIRIYQQNYGDPNIYSVKLDNRRNGSRIVPFIPKNGMWSGFALTNPHEVSVKEVYMTTYGASGDPLHTVFGPVEMAPGEKRLILFSDLPVRKHEFPDTDQVVVMSESPLAIVNLFANKQADLACFNGKAEARQRLILPDTSGPMDMNQSVFAELINRSYLDHPVEVSVYSKEGRRVSTQSIPLNPMEALYIRGGTYPFTSLPNDGWIEVKGSRSALIGYEYLKTGGAAESIYGLSVDAEPKMIPHVPPPGYWATVVTLINPTDTPNTVRFHPRNAGGDDRFDQVVQMGPYEKKTIEIQDWYGKFPGEFLFGSIVDIIPEKEISGYVTYRTPNDAVSLPLNDQSHCESSKTLPHYPGTEQGWWTGVCLFNSMPEAVTVYARPFDAEGNPGSVQELVLEAGSTEVFTLQDLFGTDRTQTISFVDFTAADGKIGGFYLYGNHDNTMLSGADM